MAGDLRNSLASLFQKQPTELFPGGLSPEDIVKGNALGGSAPLLSDRTRDLANYFTPWMASGVRSAMTPSPPPPMIPPQRVPPSAFPGSADILTKLKTAQRAGSDDDVRTQLMRLLRRG